MRKTLTAVILSLALSVAAVPSGAGAETVMKLASATINDVQHEWQKVFAEKLAQKLGDEIKTEIYPASQLGPIPQMVEGVLFGTMECFITPTSFLSGTDARFQIFDAPGIFDSPEHLARVIHDPAYRDRFETIALDKGIRVIGAIFNSPMLVLTKAPAPVLADLRGLKIRTFASPLQMEPMTALGANPVPLALTEVIPALQAGNIDGMLAGMPILTAFKYYDVAKYVTALEFQQIVSVAVVNEAWFMAQSPEAQQAIREAGREAEQAVLPWGIANVARTNQAWVDNGGEILRLSAEEQSEMMTRFSEIGGQILAADPSVWAEYEHLMEVVETKRDQ